MRGSWSAPESKVARLSPVGSVVENNDVSGTADAYGGDGREEAAAFIHIRAQGAHPARNKADWVVRPQHAMVWVLEDNQFETANRRPLPSQHNSTLDGGATLQ